MSILMYMLRNAIKHSPFAPRVVSEIGLRASSSGEKPEKPITPRMEEFKKKLREKTPIGKLDEIEGKHPHQEKEPLEKFPHGINPITGEIGGPIGPEPTRYGDWERKGRVSDF